jgi:lipopolysaccharide transport system permease protein
MALVNPLSLVSELWQQRYLLGQLVKRDVLLRYRGAMFGVLWVLLSPLFMLAVFAYVFGQIYPARWPAGGGPPYWLQLYAGLITFNLFAETVSRAPASVRSHPSYVKKIIFPVHILPVVPLGAALVHGLFNYFILLTALGVTGHWHWQVLLFPLLLLPVLLLALGVAWFVGAWGVFIKDMTQIIPMFVQVLMFVSPVFYPVYALGVVIEANRALANGLPPAWSAWAWALLAGTVTMLLGHAFFRHAREEFADAL